MVRLGGGSFVISPDMSIHGLEVRDGIVMDGVAAEHIREAVPVIASYGDAIGIRAFADRKKIENDLAETRFSALTELIDTPYINMESAMNHPCQSLADWKTMDDHDIPANGGKFVLSWAYHPRALPLAVPSATLHMAAKSSLLRTRVAPSQKPLTGKKRWKARRLCTPSHGRRRGTMATSWRTRNCVNSISTGALTNPGSTMQKTIAGSCIACRSAAASSLLIESSTDRAAS
jgi:N-acetylornithine carbamoyltransferase